MEAALGEPKRLEDAVAVLPALKLGLLRQQRGGVLARFEEVWGGGGAVVVWGSGFVVVWG